MIIQNQVVQKPTFFHNTQDFLSTFVDYKFMFIPSLSVLHSFSSLLLYPISKILLIFKKTPKSEYIYMSTTVCQNIIFPCFEPQLMAETATTLPPPPASSLQFSNWGCRQIFYDDPTNCKESLGNYGFYTDPLSEKSSISRLSAKSLEMCTENLGSETGTDIITDGGSIFSSSSSSFSSFDQENSSSCKGNDQEKLRTKMKQYSRNEEANSCRKFPPPLTTMSGTCSIQVRRHCEGGRLIIEAIERPLRNSYLQVERSGGRLRLCYLTDSESDCDLDKAEPPEVEEEEEAEEGEGGFESGMEEFGIQSWLSRCKERRHEDGGLCSNWKPALWVATS